MEKVFAYVDTDKDDRVDYEEAPMHLHGLLVSAFTFARRSGP